MFDIGFFEICLIAIIALLVIGPEKLPRVARTTGLWVGKMRGMVKTVQYEIDEQIRIEELKKSLERAAQPINDEITKTISDTEKSFQQAKSNISEETNLSTEASSILTDIKKP